MVRVREQAPDFSTLAVVNGQFKKLSLAEFKSNYLVLFFYPCDFTFVCPTEIIAFSDRVKEFKEINCNVLGCSTDTHFSHLAWINQPRSEGGLGHMEIPLLADTTKEMAKAYNVLIENGDENAGVALRGLFIIDGKGVVRHITVNDLPVGRSVDEVLRVVKALQYTDQHGEVCPADWNPGKETMVPTPDGSKSYFEKSASKKRKVAE